MISVRSLELDQILFNGRFYTMDENLSVAEAVAVKDGRFAAVGQTQEVRALAGEHTRLVDLGGRPVLPGIFDSHNHLMEVGAKLSMIRLDECTSPEEMMELVRAAAKNTSPGEWIVGLGWNEGVFKDGRLPTRHDIDPATADHPVILMRFFNMDVVNSYAIRLAGVNRDTPDPAGGKIEHDPDGEPNGLFRASAKRLIRQHVPKPTLEQMKEQIRLGCAEMNRFGITSVIEPGLYPRELHAYQAAYASGLLTLRLNLMPSWHGFKDDEDPEILDYRSGQLGLYSGFGDEWLRIGALKMAIDGGTSSHTAYMYAPFNGESEVRNFNRLDQQQLYRYFRTAQEQGWDVGIHCCGDRAQDLAVDAFARVIDELPAPDARHSIIHAYFPTQHALNVMAKYRIAAVLQPTFIYYEGEMLFRDVSMELAHHYKPARSYLDNGVVVTASSDVESTVSANPFPALYALVARKNREGVSIGPGEAISRVEALRTYTTGGAWLTREETIKGSIEVSKLADLVVLDRDYFTVSEEEIRHIHADETMINGQFIKTNPFG